MVYRTKQDLIRAIVSSDDIVLDIGFSGQGIQANDPRWPHAIIKATAHETYGVDLELTEELRNDQHYAAASAEDFDFTASFDLIFAGDLIEHLSNPGLFLERCRKHLAKDGRLVLTTPNTFNLFNIAEKFTKREPTVNSDHTFYFNVKTLTVLLAKNNFKVEHVDYIYTLGYAHQESWKKRFLNMLYRFCSQFTDKFIETLVITATVK